MLSTISHASAVQRRNVPHPAADETMKLVVADVRSRAEMGRMLLGSPAPISSQKMGRAILARVLCQRALTKDAKCLKVFDDRTLT